MNQLSSLHQGLKMAGMSLLMASFVACAHKIDRVEYPVATDPNAKLAEVKALYEKSNGEQMFVLSPRNYKAGERAYQKAARAQEKGSRADKILEDLGYAEAYFIRGHELATQQVLPQVTIVAEARQRAISSQAREVVARELRNIDEDFIDITSDLEAGKRNVDSRDLVELQARYLELQAMALRQDKLSEAYSLMKRADDLRASRYAPNTHREAQTAITSAENVITAERDNNDAIVEQSALATAAARKALRVTEYARNAGGNASQRETVALQMWEKDQALSQVNRELSNVELEAEALKATTAALGATAEDLATRTSRLQSEAEWNAAIEEARQQFTAEEADVYRQGDRLIIRLKSIQFPSARSEVPSQSMPTLQKVSSVISSLNAGEVIVEGHTDAVGSSQLNKELSQARADSVKQFLASATSIDAERIETEGFGYEKPITTNKTPQGRAQNRRVDIVIVP